MGLAIAATCRNADLTFFLQLIATCGQCRTLNINIVINYWDIQYFFWLSNSSPATPPIRTSTTTTTTTSSHYLFDAFLAWFDLPETISPGCHSDPKNRDRLAAPKKQCDGDNMRLASHSSTHTQHCHPFVDPSFTNLFSLSHICAANPFSKYNSTNLLVFNDDLSRHWTLSQWWALAHHPILHTQCKMAYTP